MRLSFCALAGIILVQSAAKADELAEICNGLVTSGLIDKQDKSMVVDTATREFREVCEYESSMESRYKGSSGSFQAAFKAFSAKAGGSKNSSLNLQSIKAACDLTENAFAYYLTSEENTSTGSYLAKYVVDCVGILAASRQEAILGTTETSPDDRGFTVNLRYVPGETPITYSFLGEPSGTKCYRDKANGVAAEGNVSLVANGEDAFFCEKPVNEDVKGAFVFEGNVDGKAKRRTVPYTIRSVNVQKENALEVERRVAVAIAQFETLTKETATILDSRMNQLSAALESKTRPIPETYYIYGDIPLGERQPGVETVNTSGLDFYRKRLMGTDEGICVLSGIGAETGGTLSKRQNVVLQEQGAWYLKMYVGPYSNFQSTFAGSTCWRFK